MSLLKRYGVSCNGNDYRHRKGLPFGGASACKGTTRLLVDSATEARRAARIEGWKRHSEMLDILPDTPSAGQSKQTFDLCPVCAFALLPLDA